MAQQATLYNPETGDRQAVDVDSQDAQNLFGQDYYLETSYNPETGESTWDAGDSGDTTAPPEPPPEDTTPTDGGVDQQQPIDIDEDTTEEDGLTDDEQETQNLSEEAQLIIDQQMADLETFTSTMDENNKAYIEEIRRSFEIRKRQMEQLNKASLAGVTKAGIRSGRQRYASEINTGILTAEESAGIQRLAELDAQERMLILEAKMAMDEKSMELLDKKYSLIKEKQALKEKLVLDLRTMAIQEEQRVRDRMTWERQKDTWAKEDAGTRLESMLTGGIGLDSLNDEEYNQLETDLGLATGSLENFYNGLKAAQEAQAVNDEIKLQQSIVSLLNSTPQGMEITIGDKTYSGLKDTVDRMSYTYTDAANNKKYEVVIDKVTGEELYRKDMGSAYKPTGSGDDGDTSESEAAEMMTAQLSTVIGPDGFISPDDYLAARNAWIAQGFNPTTFDTKFKGFRNPNNEDYIINTN